MNWNLAKRFTAIILLVLFAVVSPAVSQLSTPIFQGTDPNTNLPLAGGKLYSYVVGTSTPKSTFSNVNLTVPRTNPVILDAYGQSLIYLSGPTDLVLKDSDDVTLWGPVTVNPSGGTVNAYISGGTQAIINATLTAIGSAKTNLTLSPETWTASFTLPSNITLNLLNGTIINGTVVLPSNGNVIGQGKGSQISLITAIGTSGAHLNGITIKDLTATIHPLTYVDDSQIINCAGADLYMNSCTRVQAEFSSTNADYVGVNIDNCNWCNFKIPFVKNSGHNSIYVVSSSDNTFDVGYVVGSGQTYPSSAMYFYDGCHRNTGRVGTLAGTTNSEYGLQFLRNCTKNSLTVDVIKDILRGTSAEGANLQGCDNNNINIGVIYNTAICSLELSQGSSNNNIKIGACLQYGVAALVDGVSILSEILGGGNESNGGYTNGNTVEVGYIDGSSRFNIRVGNGGGTTMVSRGNIVKARCGRTSGYANLSLEYAPDTKVDISYEDAVSNGYAISNSSGSTITSPGKGTVVVPKDVLIPNPIAAINSSGWGVSGGGGTVTRETSPTPKFGTAYIHDVPGAQFRGVAAPSATIKSSTTYQISFWLRGTVTSATMRITPDVSAVVNQPPINPVPATWTRYTYSWTSGATDAGVLIDWYTSDAAPGANYIDITGIMIEENSYSSNFPEAYKGQIALTAGTTTVVYNSLVRSDSNVFLQALDANGPPLNAFVSAISNGVSFTITHGAAAGTEVFNYKID